MALSINNIKKAIQPLMQAARHAYPQLELFPILVAHDSPNKALLHAKQRIKNKPYEKSINIILQREFTAQYSRFLGITIYRKKILFGLKEQEKTLCVFTLNTAQINDILDVKRLFWHMISHSLDCYDIRQTPKYKKSFLSGPMIPKRPANNTAFTNLKADIFSLLILSKEKNNYSVPQILKNICYSALGTKAVQEAALYPVPIAASHTYFATETIAATHSLVNAVKLARGLSSDILSAFDKSILKNWFDFTEAAQEMARLGYSPEEILSAATNISENTFIRSIAQDLSKLMNIQKLPSFSPDKNYIPFIPQAINSKTHGLLVQETYNRTLKSALVNRSSKPLIDEAIKQCHSLLNGHAIGWCAYSLFEAVHYIDQHPFPYENTRDSGFKPYERDLLELFEKNFGIIAWPDLYAFSSRLLKIAHSDIQFYYKNLYQNALQNPSQSMIAKTLGLCLQHNQSCFMDLKHISMDEPPEDITAHYFAHDDDGEFDKIPEDKERIEWRQNDFDIPGPSYINLLKSREGESPNDSNNE